MFFIILILRLSKPEVALICSHMSGRDLVFVNSCQGILRHVQPERAHSGPAALFEAHEAQCVCWTGNMLPVIVFTPRPPMPMFCLVTAEPNAAGANNLSYPLARTNTLWPDLIALQIYTHRMRKGSKQKHP